MGTVKPPYHQDDEIIVHHGDCLDVLPQLAENSVDSIVTDPPYSLGFMGRSWDTFGQDIGRDAQARIQRAKEVTPTGQGHTTSAGPYLAAGVDSLRAAGMPYQAWCQQWATECLRVLKPGGHMLCFGGTRTYHRLACAIEDAGFEIRDSIAWIYGSGFPKSLDVSKAIDKAAGAERQISGYKPIAYPDSGCWGTPNANSDGSSANPSSWSKNGIQTGGVRPITAPATDVAKQWQGWGTALKPAFEPVIVARKPLGGVRNVRAFIENGLRQRGVIGDIQWASSAANAEKLNTATNSGTTPPAEAEDLSAKPANANVTDDTANAIARCTASHNDASTNAIRTGVTPTASDTLSNSDDKSSSTTAQPVDAAANIETHSSFSTTSTAAEISIENLSTVRSTPNLDDSDSRPATESYAGIATGLTGSLAHVHIKKNRQGLFEWPDDLPECIAVDSTVAANVLQWGTGALNIDATRIGVEPRWNPPVWDLTSIGSSRAEPKGNGTTVAGRWPANAVFDPAAAAELDKQSGTSAGRPAKSTMRGEGSGSLKPASGVPFVPGNATTGYLDEGGASRFFYCPKASRDQRPTANGTSHPTVKPVELIRWLIRLVTPPHGTVLDPFAGTASTAEAVILEHRNAILIEREAEYLPLIKARLTKPMQVGFDFDKETI